MTEAQIAFAALIVGVVAAVIALMTWLRPRNPEVRIDKYTQRIRSVEDAYRFYEFLIKRQGQRAWLNVMIDPRLVTDHRTGGEDYPVHRMPTGLNQSPSEHAGSSSVLVSGGSTQGVGTQPKRQLRAWMCLETDSSHGRVGLPCARSSASHRRVRGSYVGYPRLVRRTAVAARPRPCSGAGQH
jgi:hypothetical protein